MNEPRDLAEAYRPPLVDGDEPRRSAASSFYVVAPSKLIALQLFTLRLYSFYWFFRQWAHLKHEQGRSIAP
jgi:hypothetical protein